LDQYAKNKNTAHLPVWRDFNLNVGSNGDVGIWHETYLSKKGSYEAVYNNMPRFGLAKVGRHVSATGKFSSASGRMNSDSK